MPPAKKRKAPKQGSSGGSDDGDYRKKRDRNNQASIFPLLFFLSDCSELICYRGAHILFVILFFKARDVLNSFFIQWFVIYEKKELTVFTFTSIRTLNFKRFVLLYSIQYFAGGQKESSQIKAACQSNKGSS